MTALTIRAYGPLSEFLPTGRRQSAFSLAVDGRPSVKEVIESIGIPHTEAALLLIDGHPVGFDRQVDDGSRIAAFPAFMQLEAATISPIHQPLPEPLRFIADVHLGTLARLLRLLGLDTAYERDADDVALASAAVSEHRVLLTRDVALLKRRALVHGYFVRHTRPERQLPEVLLRFGPAAVHPFSRCLRCNGSLRDVPKHAIAHRLPPMTLRHNDEFRRCDLCGRLYWRGSHAPRLDQIVASACATVGIRFGPDA